MIFGLRRDPLMCLGGRFYETPHAHEGEYFEYEPMGEVSRNRDIAVRNLVITEGVTVIRTNWDLPFRPGTYVLLADGNNYLIESTSRAPASTSFQALTVCAYPEQDWVLSLRLVSNLRGDVL